MKKAYISEAGTLCGTNRKYFFCPLKSSTADDVVACQARCAYFDIEANRTVGSFLIARTVTCYGKEIAELVDEPETEGKQNEKSMDR